MSLYSYEKVFLKTVNCKLAQETGAVSLYVFEGMKTERVAVLTPKINMDLGFKYRVQLSQHLCSFDSSYSLLESSLLGRREVSQERAVQGMALPAS